MTEDKRHDNPGRPTSCDQETIDKALAYISNDETINYLSHGHAIPSVVGLCRVLNRARSTLYKWAEDPNNIFSDILADSNELQELVLLNGTLTNELNSNIGKLVLGKHGYHDKQDITGNDGGPIETKEMSGNELARRLAFVLGSALKDAGKDK